MKKVTLTFVFALLAAIAFAQTIILPFGAKWKYLDNGIDPGSAWKSRNYLREFLWKEGPSELGYGQGDEATVVNYGLLQTHKHITTYFRKNITISNPNAFQMIKGKLKRDDGVAIYVNGTEVFRNNLAAGASSNTTAITSVIDDGKSILRFNFLGTLLESGNNVIAVEIHQYAKYDPDLSFDLELVGSNEPDLIRGPYLNMVNESAVTLRWRTDLPTASKVEIGKTHGSYPTVFNDPALKTEHEVRLSGLSTGTKYFYRFGGGTQIFQAGTDNYFRTSPTTNTTRKMRFAVFGDCGWTDNNSQIETLTAYQNHIGSTEGEIMILLGDNAYDEGTDIEYEAGFFYPYERSILKNHVIMPAPGNHDYYGTSQESREGAYYKNFTMPNSAQCGGVASGTEAYYSWNRGDAHFISLDSYGKENNNSTRLYDTLGAQITWLKRDLAANTRKWTIVYFHHPPYTMGSHNSDNADGYDEELVKIRENILTIFERYGVDLVLCGHSHNYERSYLLKDYTGTESQFNASIHALQGQSSGKYNGSANSCPYQLPSGKVEHGIVYVVAGSAGLSTNTQPNYPHNAMPWSLNENGMLQLEIEGNRLDGKFIRSTGAIGDNFTIMKDVNKTVNIKPTPGIPLVLESSWIGNYNWSNNATSKAITIVPPAGPSTYTVTDGLNCLTDVFKINFPTPSLDAPDGSTSNMIRIENNSNGKKTEIVSKSFEPSEMDISQNNLRCYPNPFDGNLNIQYNLTADTDEVTLKIIDIQGRIVSTLNQGSKIAGIFKVNWNLPNLNEGLYHICLDVNGKCVKTERIILKK
jgi:3',5'-cyclic AMP phosphodiesterase CpdA